MLGLNQLLDDRNRKLYQEVSRAAKLELNPTSCKCYGCFSKGPVNRIDIPINQPPSPSSFAHELLHAKLNVKSAHISFKLGVSGSVILSKVVSDNLCDHLNNVLQHRKMFPEFLALGYQEGEFLSDAHEILLDEVGALNIAADCAKRTSAEIDFFIGKYMAARCSLFSFHDYSKPLAILRASEPRLTEIMEVLVSSWDAYDPDREGDLDAVSHFEIEYNFLSDLEDWLNSQKII